MYLTHTREGFPLQLGIGVWGQKMMGYHAEKNSGYFSVGGARSKNSMFFSFSGYPSTILRTAYRKQYYPKPVVQVESRDSEGVAFAGLESL